MYIGVVEIGVVVYMEIVVIWANNMKKPEELNCRVKILLRANNLTI
jgi:hypothetical protein